MELNFIKTKVMIKSAKQILALLFLVFTLALNYVSQGNMED